MFQFFKKKVGELGVMALEEASVKRAVSHVIDTRSHYGISGHPNVKAFEKAISQRFGNVPVVAMNSGTDALILALKLIGVGPGDEVIVPSFSFISTVSCVAWIGAIPVFIDIDPKDYAINCRLIEAKITPKTKAIIVAHLFGHPALGITAIEALARNHSLSVIEDAAQSFGAKIRIGDVWKHVGTIGDIGCLSFSSTKPFSAPGNGGAVILKKEESRKEANRARFYGAEKHYYDYPTVGVNAKLHDIQAAALLAKLPFFDYWLEHRKKIARLYADAFSDIPELTLPTEHADVRRTWYRYVIRTEKRDELFRTLLKEVGHNQYALPMINYPVILPKFSAFKKYPSASDVFPEAETASRQVISLPITNYITAEESRHIAASIRRFFGRTY